MIFLGWQMIALTGLTLQEGHLACKTPVVIVLKASILGTQPKLKLFQKYSWVNKPVRLAALAQGGREVDDFIKYLARESTEPLSGYTRDGKKVKAKKTEL